LRVACAADYGNSLLITDMRFAADGFRSATIKANERWAIWHVLMGMHANP
jgi:hypothetical protein